VQDEALEAIRAGVQGVHVVVSDATRVYTTTRVYGDESGTFVHLWHLDGSPGGMLNVDDLRALERTYEHAPE
jgi:hypothetical protein